MTSLVIIIKRSGHIVHRFWCGEVKTCMTWCFESHDNKLSYFQLFCLASNCGLGDGGSPKVAIMSPFGSLEICWNLAVILPYKLFGGAGCVLGLWVESCNPLWLFDLKTDLWWLFYQDTNKTAARNLGLLVRRKGWTRSFKHLIWCYSCCVYNAYSIC